jgi:HAD superfamily hydrolase (TIGR01509 family)
MPLDISRIKGICFDVDGTLSDTDDAYVSRLNHFFKITRIFFRKGDPTRFSRWLVMVTESPMNGLYHWLDRHSLDDEAAKIFSRLAQKGKGKARKFLLMSGAQDLLSELHQKFPLAVVSARDEGTTNRFLEQFDLGRFFRVVVTSQTCEFTKPFPHPVLQASAEMRVPPEACVMIGDTTVDILAGKRAGAQTIGLLCGFGTEDELRKAGADLIVSDLEELKQEFAGS